MKTTIKIEIESKLTFQEIESLFLNLDIQGIQVKQVKLSNNGTGTLTDLRKSHVDVGTYVMISVPETHRLYKFNGQKGRIYKFTMDVNPYPIIELERTGKRLAVELKHLKFTKQTSIF